MDPSMMNNKQRRLIENERINAIKSYLPITKRYKKKISNIDVLHVLCVYFKSQQCMNLSHQRATGKSEFLSSLNGFMIALNKVGDLLYITENVHCHLSLTPDEIILANEKIFSLIGQNDAEKMKGALLGDHERPFFVSWRARKRKSQCQKEYTVMKIKMHSIKQNGLLVAECTPVLTLLNSNALAATSAFSFATAHELDLKFKEVCKSAESLLGLNVNAALKDQSLYDLIHVEYLDLMQKVHTSLLKEKPEKGFLVYLKVLRRDGGYLNCLANVSYSSKGHIICSYQAYSSIEMAALLEHVNKNEHTLASYAHLYTGCHTVTEGSYSTDESDNESSTPSNESEDTHESLYSNNRDEDDWMNEIDTENLIRF